MSDRIGFGRFSSLDEQDAPQLLQRMSGEQLPVDGRRYGVDSRLIAKPSVEVVELAAAALSKLLAETGAKSRLGALVLSSRVVDPTSVAREAAARLRLELETVGIERACSGFPAATDIAVRLARRIGRPVAIVSAEIISGSINWESHEGNLGDHQRARGQAAALFADGAAAALVGPLDKNCPHEVLDAWCGEVAEERQLIQKVDVSHSVDPWGNVRQDVTGCISMPGRRGFWLVKKAPTVMVEAIESSMENARTSGRLDPSETTVTQVAPHQPNSLILARLEEQMSGGGADVKVWDCLARTGNTVSASIPIAMAQIQDQLESGILLAMPSVGAGGPGYRPNVLSTGCVLVRTGDPPLALKR